MPSIVALGALLNSSSQASSSPSSGNPIGGYSNTATVGPETKTRSYATLTYGTPITQRPNI
ncbi:hypothetical protein F5Y00DRAFT_224666 [Daldinia vernicosa]|uniref:uncharacterized protein n=1 Tax=Daldinia vernicosa TaxID=114800 RepID=UPI0020088AC9|nr:uncharacterized protein F5Y00DRAFT_224666 [Daldinia vernicosa]KAI0853430.1 hypothetical protein F5Y00DRAFT_224666 [Daldinia vernicosa]